MIIARPLTLIPIPGLGHISTAPGLLVTVFGVPSRRPVDILDRTQVTRVRRTISTETGTFKVQGMTLTTEYDLIGRETGGVYTDFLRPNITPAS